MFAILFDNFTNSIVFARIIELEIQTSRNSRVCLCFTYIFNPFCTYKMLECDIDFFMNTWELRFRSNPIMLFAYIGNYEFFSKRFYCFSYLCHNYSIVFCRVVNIPFKIRFPVIECHLFDEIRSV